MKELSEKQHNKSGFYDQCKDYFSENELADFEHMTITRNVIVPQVIRIGKATLANHQSGEKEAAFPLLIPFRDSRGLDEFQKLLEGNYKTAKEVNMLLEDVAKRGRSFGIHLVLCSQSLANTQLEKTTLNQIGLRIVFKIHKSECPKFLDYNNEVPAMLVKKGEAIYNTRSGLLAGNEKIQVDYIDEEMISAFIAGAKKQNRN